ncbi:ku P80 DNA helicase [Loa loa]|uniref:Ku P80 DNA helicase n=1 Tax=Loa loa TaxID=7209 RepID=A0A1I7VNC7_LOALO|nr:ku P80 DNA helicase [Loa loa]EFO26243.1 ku P80 DNA helicase [Loa loa]
MSDDDRPRKRAKKALSHECTVILIDVGANMNRKGIATTDMQLAKDTVEWIITRKIFTESADEFTLVLFGSELTQNPVTVDENIFFCEEEMQQAKIDWLRLIDKEIKPSKSTNGDFLAALIAALDYMRNHLESWPKSNITARNILLVTNLGGFNENVDEECIGAVINGMKALEINFNVIGPSIGMVSEDEDKIISNEESTIQPEEKLSNAMRSFKIEPAERVLTDILKQTDGVIYSFAEALPVLQHFVSRKVNLRGQKFNLELGIDLKLPLQMYKKIQTTDFKLAAEKYASITGTRLKRKTLYEKCVKDGEVDDGLTAMDVDVGRSDCASQGSSKIFAKEIVKGYKFGTTIVPYNAEDQKEYGWKHENRCLKLIQFTKRSQILEHYLMDGGACYFIPPALDKNACVAISALVNAMIAEDSVALTRYVYNAASQPRIMGLFPRRSKKGVDMFVGIQLPFYEDFRGLNFPPLNSPATEPKNDHLSAMHSFVQAMDLTKAHFNSQTGQFEESLRPRDVPNPKLQNVCKAIKYRALHPNAPLPAFEDKLLGDLLEPNALLLKRANESLVYLKTNLPMFESPNKKQHIKEVKEEILPRMSADNSVLPEGGKFIKTDEVDA